MGRIPSVPDRRRWRGRSAVVASSVLALTGCSTASRDNWERFGLPEGVTVEAGIVQNLWSGSWIAALAVGVAVWALIMWSAAAFRRRRGEAGLPPQVRYNIPIEVLYTVLPFIIIAVLFFFTARDESRILARSAEVENEINIVGKQWSWDFNYTKSNGRTDAPVYEVGTPGSPPTLVLPRGERVRFLLTSRDVIHSFWVPAFLFKMDVIPGRDNEFEVVPQKAGYYVGKCAEFCGLDHARMLFNTRVVEPAEYDAYLRSLAAAGKTGSLPATLGPDGTGADVETESEVRQ